MRRRHLEDDLQRAVWQWYQYANPDCILFAVPNGGLRHAREAARFKGMGVVPGVADLMLLWDGGCAAIELKVGKGTQSPAQRVFQRSCEKRAIPYRICRSIDDVKTVCEELGLLPMRGGSDATQRS